MPLLQALCLQSGSRHHQMRADARIAPYKGAESEIVLPSCACRSAVAELQLRRGQQVAIQASLERKMRLAEVAEYAIMRWGGAGRRGS